MIFLTNNDQLEGVIQQLSKDEAVLATGFALLKVPVARISQIVFAGGAARPAQPQANTVRVTLHNGSQITLQLDKLEATLLRGRSESCGTVTVPLSAISRVQFHVDAPHPVAHRSQGVDR